MDSKKGKAASEKTGMTRSHSSTSSISSIPRLPPIETTSKTIPEVPNEDMRLRLGKVLEGGKHDIMLATESVAEQARIAEQQITSRLDCLSQEINNAVERAMRNKESEMIELRNRYEEAENRAASLLERERGLVEQQSQLSIELVLKSRSKQATETELNSLEQLVEELKVKLEELVSNEKVDKENYLKAKNDWSAKAKESTDEIRNLKIQLEEEREMKKKEKENIKLDSNDKHSKESMRLHQEVNKWKLKCEKTLEEIQNIKKEGKTKEEELRREKVALEEKYKHESGQHKTTLKILEDKIRYLTDKQEEERTGSREIIQQMQIEIEVLKSKYGDALSQIDMLKRNIEEYETPVDAGMESTRLRLLRIQNQREKARLDSDRREAVRLKNLMSTSK
ncbi:hypothetical protein LOD99_218 [Oopsacas minuta]|uniref:Uncharacterized protein n=1 Tax=Oopsacas minuta TaxID=111878 RepID=A0AAV7K820_9METZ|nr:hypothetical protein LOD99_218 [Oopsacas minuta]